MNSQLKRLLQQSRRTRRQYKDPRSKRGLTGVSQARKIATALKSGGFKSRDVRSVKNFVAKAYVEHTNGARFHSNYLRDNSRSYAITAAGARTLNSFFTKHNLSIQAAPKGWMSNPAQNASRR